MNKTEDLQKVLLRELNRTDEPVDIEVIETRPSGGVFSHLKGYLFPFKGFPPEAAVEAVASVKKVLPAFVQYFGKRTFFVLAGLVFFFTHWSKRLTGKIAFYFVDFFLYFLFPPAWKLRTPPKRYCRSVREIYRLFNILAERDFGPQMRQRWIKIRDVVCMILEYDNAYRYRLQDIASEVRISDLAFDDGDKYFVTQRTDYDFFGKKLNERQKIHSELIKTKIGYTNWLMIQPPEKVTLRPEQEQRIMAITPSFQDELYRLCEKYGVILEPYLSYEEQRVVPAVRLKIKPEEANLQPEDIKLNDEIIALEKQLNSPIEKNAEGKILERLKAIEINRKIDELKRQRREKKEAEEIKKLQEELEKNKLTK